VINAQNVYFQSIVAQQFILDWSFKYSTIYNIYP
jgi:hypothetical protein